MRTQFAVITAMVLLASSASGQSSDERDAVRAAVMDYVEGFYEGDTAKLVRSVSPAVYKFGVFVGFVWVIFGDCQSE